MLPNDDPDAAGSPWLRTLAFGFIGLAMLGASVVLVMKFISGPVVKPQGVQQIALIKQPPQPPPPKPPEKLPEPPKIKEEVKIDQPTPDPKPDEPKAADEKPASDKPLAVDADGSAGSDGFGLAANRGGRDLLTTGTGGSSGAYYSGLMQRHFLEALTRNRKVLKDEFRVVVKVWFGDDGRVQKADIVVGSGDAQVDDQIQVTLLDMAPLKDVPPAAMRPMQVRLSNRS